MAQMVSPDGENHVTQKARKAQKFLFADAHKWRPAALGCFAAGMSRRNRRNRRKFYSLTLINYFTQKARKTQKCGLRPCAASQLWGTQMAQITQIVFRAFLKLVIGRNYLYLPTEIMNKGESHAYSSGFIRIWLSGFAAFCPVRASM